MLQVQNLAKSFKTSGGIVRAIDDISFTIEGGSFAAIVGKSGSGKSTLLSLLGTLDKPSSGTIVVDEHKISRMHNRALTQYRCKSIGFVFQQFNLIPNLSALENVMLPMEFAHVPHHTRKARAIELLQQVGIDLEKQKRKPNRLSGGEQQRVAIARALANKPAMILADEPTGNLDSETGQRIIDLLRNVARDNGTTTIIVTHDLGIARQCDQILKIADGKLVP